MKTQGLASNLHTLQTRIRPPVAVALGSPAEVVSCVEALREHEPACWQIDLYQASRLQAMLQDGNRRVTVVTRADLWDLPPVYRTVVFPAPRGLERELKLDVVEQAYHVLAEDGLFVVLSDYAKDELFPAALKKVFGRYHAPESRAGQIFWARRAGARPRRRHEVTFQVRTPLGGALRLKSRPGVFSYGRFDNGARALCETAALAPGERCLDLGCGTGSNGIWAWTMCQPDGEVVFVDSNVRALALTVLNARGNGVERFRTVTSDEVAQLDIGTFDVALANPPYYAQQSIARRFVGWSRRLLRPSGRLYLVTKQPREIEPLLAEAFAEAAAVHRRGYELFTARRPMVDSA